MLLKEATRDCPATVPRYKGMQNQVSNDKCDSPATVARGYKGVQTQVSDENCDSPATVATGGYKGVQKQISDEYL